MAQVEIRSITKRFGTSTVLNRVDILVEHGWFVVLVGPSGCGKSTLLRVIAGLESASEGEIRIGSLVVNNVHPRDRDVAMVFQNYALYPHMTVEQNMGFALKLRGVSSSEIKARVNHAAETLQIGMLLNRYPRQLSGGQRQRVAMGRALVRSPQVFLFDEPLSNLDAKLRVAMRVQIKELHQRLGATMIYVTHDQIEAMTMGDQIVVMRDGMVEQIAPPLELYDNPVNTFVASFIGSPAMNFIPGRIESGGLLSDFGVRLPLVSNLPLPEGRTVVYGVRPEHFGIGDDGFPAEVSVVQPTGPETQIVVKLSGHEVTCIVPDRLSIQPGQIVHLKPDPSRVHLFDSESKRRIN